MNTAKQLSLAIDLPPMKPVKYRRGMTIEERFKEFHAQNPHVLTILTRMTYDLKKAGFKRFGLRLLWGKLRWEYALQTKSADTFKLNDHYVALYARMIMEQNPDLDGFFETRKRKAH